MRVIVAYVHSHEVAHSWHVSMEALRAWDLQHDAHVAGTIRLRCGFQGVPAARNAAVSAFLSIEGYDWLWWVDTDMGFRPDTVDRLLEAADPVQRPVVGALAFAHKYPDEDGLNGYRTEQVATIYDWVSTDEARGFIARPSYPVNELVRCAGTGSACILIHRRVFECIRATQPDRQWYDPVPNPGLGGMIGEDLSFCLRCAIAGIPIHVHTGIPTNHQKTVWLNEPAGIPEEPHVEATIPTPAG